jgi:hypothetical protein
MRREYIRPFVWGNPDFPTNPNEIFHGRKIRNGNKTKRVSGGLTDEGEDDEEDVEPESSIVETKNCGMART